MNLQRAWWYLNRLGAMSLPEVWYRLRQWALVEQERHRVFQANHTADEASALDSWTRFRDSQGVRFFFGWDERDAIIDLYGQKFVSERDTTQRTASFLLHHTFAIFGRELNLGPQIDWHRDPLTGQEWPPIFWADIDIRDGQTIGGVKWVWELNRHHHMVTLGKAYFLSGEEAYAKEVCAQLADWITANPPYMGVNWTSPLELAIRLINWVWALAFVKHSPALTPELFATVLQSIQVQSGHISRHLSAFSSANNHLIGEAAALAVIGLTFPWLGNADRWRDLGLGTLKRELERQVYPDGVPAEQALHYLAFVLDFSLLAWRLAALSGIDGPPGWYERLRAGCDFIRHVVDGQGNVPSIGDSDDAWVVRLDERPKVNNFRSILATAAVLLESPEFKASAGRWDEKSHWLLGEQGRKIYEALPAKASGPASRAFRQGGYCVMRAPECVVVFDCGPLGYLSTAVHGHADALSLTLSLKGQPVLIDPGTYAYQEGGEWRDYFRSTAAHNTVVIDGYDQSKIQGTFLWGRKAKTQLLCWRSTAEYDLAIAQHDGYRDQGAVHRRTVAYHKPDWIIVVDRVQGKGEHSFEQLWHLPAGCLVNIGTDHVALAVSHQQFVLIPVDAMGAEVQTRKGEDNPVQGWTSPHYGQIEPAPVVSFSGQSLLPLRLAVAVYLHAYPHDTDLCNRAAQVLGLVESLEREAE